LDRLIRAETAKLEHFFDHIVSCRVHVERAHQRNLHASPLHVRIELSVPGEHLVVDHSSDVRPPSASRDDDFARIGKASGRQAEQKDPQLAVRDAFRSATRRLQDYAERRRARFQ
jgi:hypothetical protein